MNMADGNTAALRIYEREQDRAPVVALADMKEARETLIEDFIDGKQFERHDLETVIDDAINSGSLTARDLYEMLAGIGNIFDHDRYERIQRIVERLTMLVEFYLDRSHPELIDERAQKIAADRLADTEE